MILQPEFLQLKDLLRKITDVSFANGLLSWDQEVYMPPKGAATRASQSATLSGIAHELFTGKEMQGLLGNLTGNSKLSEFETKNVALVKKDFDRHKKYSTAFVEKLSKTVSESFIAWQEARKKNNFQLFKPFLDKLIQLKKEECELLGYENHPYNAMLDLYEPGITVAELDVIFDDVAKKLGPFVRQILEQPEIDNSVLYQHYNKDKQWNFGIDLLKNMGYDFDAGRQDISSHPFSIGFGPNDVRVTTRIDENNLSEMIWSCIHEGGHALYEQGFEIEYYGLPACEASSLAVHESQSRLWENMVGRSLPYWAANYPALQNVFADQLKNVSLNDFYRMINKVSPSLIRTNADELTYQFHVMIRYEIEKAILTNEIKTDELPEFWNSQYAKYLSVSVPDDASGILQDIHWSHGSFGYFPTYSLGSFYSTQYFYAAEKQIPGLHSEIQKNNMAPLLNWLRKNIHNKGRMENAQELCLNATGEKLNFSYFMNYATKKYSTIYNLKNK